MVLSKVEFDTAEIGDVMFTEKAKVSSLFQLRQSTRSFLIQCLADRELQTLIYSKADYSASRSAYSYNCSVVHNPHVWCHLNAISGHGWNIRQHQPIDPKLKVAHVLANQYSNNQKDNDENLVKRNQQAREQIQQFEETIRILKEENAKVKQFYLNVLKKERPQNVNHNNIATNIQQVDQFQKEIRTLKAVIESHKTTIQILKDHNYGLQCTVNDHNQKDNDENLVKRNQQAREQIQQFEETIRILKEENAKVKQFYLNVLKKERPQNVNHNNIATNIQQVDQFQKEKRTLKAVIESHKTTIQILKDHNYGLQCTVNDCKTELSSKTITIASNNQLIRNLQQELRTIKYNLDCKMENIQILENQNNNLQVRLRNAESSNASLPRTSGTENIDNVSRGCCTIM